jgi:hypothetical protein
VPFIHVSQRVSMRYVSVAIQSPGIITSDNWTADVPVLDYPRVVDTSTHQSVLRIPSHSRACVPASPYSPPVLDGVMLYATGASAIGVPGRPELAACTASIDKVRMVSIQRTSRSIGTAVAVIA